MDKQSRRDLIRDFKEAKAQAGVFAVRCAASGEAWVGPSKNIGQQQNGLWFSLRMGPGGRFHPDLHKAYAAHGADGLAFEVVEVIDDEGLGGYGLDSQLKDRLAHWLAALGAKKAFG